MPLTPQRSQRKTITLINKRKQAVPLTLTIRYNSRTDSWYLSIDDSTGQRFVSGQRLSAQADLMARFQHVDDAPSAAFYIRRLDDELAEIGFEHLEISQLYQFVLFDDGT